MFHTHLIWDVLSIRLALGGTAGKGTCTHIAEVDLSLWGRATSWLTSYNDGTSRQNLNRNISYWSNSIKINKLKQTSHWLKRALWLFWQFRLQRYIRHSICCSILTTEISDNIQITHLKTNVTIITYHLLSMNTVDWKFWWIFNYGNVPVNRPDKMSWLCTENHLNYSCS